MATKLKPGARVRVLRPRKPFAAVVIRVNSRTVTVRDERGKVWRVSLSYPMSVGGRRVAAAPPAPKRAARTRRRTYRAEDDPPPNPPRRLTKRDVMLGAAEMARRAPRAKGHMFSGKGDGISGWLWAQKKGLGKFIVVSSNGEYSYKSLEWIGNQLQTIFPGLYTWVTLD